MQQNRALHGQLPTLACLPQGGSARGIGQQEVKGGATDRFCIGLPCIVAASTTGQHHVVTPVNERALHDSTSAILDPVHAAVIHARLPRSLYSALEFPVTLSISCPLLPSPALVDTHTMVDSSTSCCFIHPRFVAEQWIPMICKRHPMKLCTIDNSEIRSGLIMDKVHLQATIGNHMEALMLDVANIGDDNIILGVSWLQDYNLDINWGRSMVVFRSDHCQEKCLPPGSGTPQQVVPKGPKHGRPILCTNKRLRQ